MRKVLIGDDARDCILAGAKLLHDAVSVTLGPKGQNAVIETYGDPLVTHDGITVARHVDIEDRTQPGLSAGVNFIKASSARTNTTVGDGTTTSTVLAYALLEKGINKIKLGKNPMTLRKELEEASKIVLDKLETISEKIETQEKMTQIATLSAENQEIGKIVGEMYYKLGKDAHISCELGNKSHIEYEITKGYSFETGIVSPYMITNVEKREATVENPAVLVKRGTIELKSVGETVKTLYQDGKDSLVVIADDFAQDLINYALQTRNDFKIICIKAPGFGDTRDQYLADISALCGTTVDGEVGTCEKITSDYEQTVIKGGADVTEHIAKLKGATNELGEELLRQRISRLKSSIGVIRVGADTEIKAEELLHLVEDAIAATRAAINKGVVPGGATTYIELSKELDGKTDGSALLKEALSAPFRKLMENAGERGGVQLENIKEFGKGFDVMSGKIVDLKEKGIIDPTLVVNQAVTNAVSIAGSALTTGVLIAIVEDKDEKTV